jgi:hypothetical protein
MATYDQTMRLQAAARVYQQRYDDALQPWAVRAPAPVLGEDINEYRAKLAILAKHQLPPDHQLRKVQYRRLDSDVFDNFEPQLLRACRQEAYNPASVPPGEYRKVVEIAPDGMKIVKWIGQRSFIEDFKPPVRRVVSFLTPHGRVNGAGIPVR